MLQRPPATPGMSEDEVDTPALIVDLDALEHNLDRMAAYCAKAGVRLRAHAKTHKSPVIAHWQIARGAVGQCVQKVAEAEVLAWGGVGDILVSNEVVSPAKLARLAALARMSRVAVCADTPAALPLLEQAAEAAGTRLSVLVEVDVGAGRCGLPAGGPSVDLARRIAASRHLRFGGLQAYHGAAQHQRTPAERRASVDGAVAAVVETLDGLRAAGLEAGIVGGAGTGTFELEGASGVYTEIQAGSYIFMDADYGRNTPAPDFRQSLYVLTGVMSARDGLAVVDCGHKGIAVDSGLPMVADRPGLVYHGPSDEHGMLDCREAESPPLLGEKLRLVPGHCDPTVDRYDWYVGLRKGRVESVWPIAARGAMA
ncbi:DSD1 family PLP-dependent enzyme [Acidimangrovimonas sediminis]|uniref:DSD1 family PLP-dependent enzyme n=1 Tax=Acidimangrovimonas sediminis TaxID=2056283 RepID=UPI000C80CDB2|nr:DSD1 family PLP-dependent enzyme [Acidimangrovimonas sediminis]